MIRPGEVYTADFEQAGPHPVIVVSRENLNRGSYALVVVCTSARFAVRRTLPTACRSGRGKSGSCRIAWRSARTCCPSRSRNSIWPRGRSAPWLYRALRDVIEAIGHVPESDREPD